MVKMILTPTQMDATKATGEHILIKGVPGSGKTTVLLAKLEKILETETNVKILFITYNNTLQKYINDYLFSMVDSKSKNVDVLTYHKWAKKMLESIYEYKNPVRYDTFDKFFNQLNKENKTHRFYTDNKYKDFILEEIQWIKNKAITNYQTYKTITRTGRGVALQVTDRKIIYEILCEYDLFLQEKKLIMWEDYSNAVDSYIQNINRKFKYDYVFIDEAQDLSQSQLISLRKLARKSLIIAADLGQKIYKTDFTWKSVGINVQGGRTKSLTGVYRSTKEIMVLANSLLKHDTALKKGDIMQSYDAEESDIVPVLCIAEQINEYDMVAELAKEILENYLEDDYEGTIGILNFTKRNCDIIQFVLKQKGLHSEIVRDQQGSTLTPGIKILTLHGAKGLEFDTVIITGMNKNYPNLKNTLDEEQEEVINTARRLLYVSMTRAKDNLYITYKGEPSMYINELDTSLYDIERY